ncbi:NBPF family member NBPF4-like [Megaptera novaeangliae]
MGAPHPGKTTFMIMVSPLPENQTDHSDLKGSEAIATRLSRELPQMVENGVPWDSLLDEYYLIYSVLPGLSDSFWPYTSAAFISSEEVDVSYARDVTNLEEDTVVRIYQVREILADGSGKQTKAGSHTVLEEEEDQDLICSSPPDPTKLSMELLVIEENEVQQDSLDECDLAGSIGHHLSDSCTPYRSASFQSDKREVSSVLSVNERSKGFLRIIVVHKPEMEHMVIVRLLYTMHLTKQAPRTSEMGVLGGISTGKLGLVLLNPLFLSGDWEDCHQRPLSFQGPGVQTSQAQLQKSTHMTNYLQLQLDQHFNCGHSKGTLGLSSTIWGFTANPDSGSQGPLFLELGLDASIGMKNPPKLKGEVLAASKPEYLVYSKINALSVLKQKIIRRKLLFSKWRLACRFPGLQA